MLPGGLQAYTQAPISEIHRCCLLACTSVIMHGHHQCIMTDDAAKPANKRPRDECISSDAIWWLAHQHPHHQDTSPDAVLWFQCNERTVSASAVGLTGIDFWTSLDEVIFSSHKSELCYVCACSKPGRVLHENSILPCICVLTLQSCICRHGTATQRGSFPTRLSGQ